MIHEAACAGLPILASACCGAVSCFVKDGENGFLFKPANKRSIRKTIERFIRLPEWQWVQMGRRSRKLSERITPSKVADCILAVLNDGCHDGYSFPHCIAGCPFVDTDKGHTLFLSYSG